MLRFLTAGESHGPELVAIVEGVPAGFEIDLARINHDLARRQKGYGRGGRMLIEKDEVRLVSGIRFGRTMGSPVTFIILNRDFKNWEKRMSADPADAGEAKVVTRPRPGHADLAGVLKYNLDDIRDVLERASARETTARVAIGALAMELLRAVRDRRAGLRREYRLNRGENSARSELFRLAAHHRGVAGARRRSCRRARDYRRDRRLQEDRRYSGRRGRGRRNRASGRSRQPRAMGSQARRTPGARAARACRQPRVSSLARAFKSGGSAALACTMRSDTTRARGASPANQTTPAARKAACPPESR